MKRIMISLLSLLAVLSLIFGKESSAKATTSYQVKVHYIYNNNPIHTVQVVAKNYEVAKQKLIKGRFKNSDFDHFSVSKLKTKYEVHDSVVKINETLSFGKDISLSEDSANTVLLELYRNNLDFLDFINDFGPQVTMTNPKNEKYKFTDERGLTHGLLEEGATIFVSSVSSDDLLLKDITKNQTLYMGNTTQNKGITVGLSDNLSPKSVSVDYGQTLMYKIPTSNRNSLIIDVSPNFVVESINYPYKKDISFVPVKEGKNGKLVDGTSLNLFGDVFQYPIKNQDENSKIQENIAKKLGNLQSIYRLIVDLSEKNNDFIIIKGHVASKVTYNLKTEFLAENSQHSSIKTETFEVYNTSPEQGIFVSDGKKYIQTPQLKSFNINFAMFDSYSNVLRGSGEYILGRIDKNNQLSLYKGAIDGKPIWKFQKHRNIVKYEDGMNIKGNTIYSLDGETRRFDFVESVWDYNESEQSKVNETLFALRGLSNQYKYVLYQVAVPKGYELVEKPIDFKVGESSQNKAQFSNYQINGQILDMEYGQNEYNALALKPKGKKTKTPVNPYIMTGIGILGIIGVSALIVIVLIKFK